MTKFKLTEKKTMKITDKKVQEVLKFLQSWIETDEYKKNPNYYGYVDYGEVSTFLSNCLEEEENK